ncbi:expressed unknown protein [Seminavis robusta]|uniref:Uncharacterized protein n=1 Tax=Seminavis robusta TaxID=568900 RepID=A0A9N8HCH1_9STRA|nr:expressed unknown protein [Seminavis robusta]|eukprot:Sro409_g137160.1 n/a (167) ;mRNA; r:20936-21436
MCEATTSPLSQFFSDLLPAQVQHLVLIDDNAAILSQGVVRSAPRAPTKKKGKKKKQKNFSTDRWEGCPLKYANKGVKSLEERAACSPQRPQRRGSMAMTTEDIPSTRRTRRSCKPRRSISYESQTELKDDAFEFPAKKNSPRMPQRRGSLSMSETATPTHVGPAAA